MANEILDTFIDLPNWKAFVDYVYSIDSTLLSSKKSNLGHHSEPLFRGQPNSDWKLTTTLERIDPTINLASYHTSYVVAAHSYLSSFNDRTFIFDKHAVPSYRDIDYHKIPNYEFMAYLRHHGFPSPLLDWTASPFVAAFFAFDTVSNSDKVAFFWLQEYFGSGKSVNENETRIFVAGPWASVHKRHFLQQSQYSVCFKKQGSEVVFMSHEDVLIEREKNNSHTEEDIIIKVTLPAHIRTEALKELDRMNINPYSIYNSEDALVKTVGNRLFR